MGEDPSWNLVSTASSSRPNVTRVKEEPDPEVAKLKKELEEVKQEFRALGQAKRTAKEERTAMPVESAATQETLTEIVSFVRSMASRLDSLEAKK